MIEKEKLNMIDVTIDRLKNDLSQPAHSLNETYNISKLLDEVKNGEELDIIISWCIMYYYQGHLFYSKILEKNFNFKDSKLEPLMRMFTNTSDENKFAKSFYDSISQKDYDMVRKLIIVRSLYKYNSEKMFRLVIKDICMIEIFLEMKVYPSQDMLFKLIRSGYITNSLYMLEKYKVNVTNDDLLFNLYELTIAKFKSHRLFYALFKLYKLPNQNNLYLFLCNHPEFTKKISYLDLRFIKNYYKN